MAVEGLIFGVAASRVCPGGERLRSGLRAGPRVVNFGVSDEQLWSDA